MFDYGPYPPVNVYITMEIHHAINGKINYTWQFSIAMLNYQRVSLIHHDIRVKPARGGWRKFLAGRNVTL